MTTRLHLPGLNRQVILYLLHSGLFYVGLFGITDVVLNFYFVSLGHEPDVIGVLQGLPRLGGLLTGIPAGLLANRIGARRLTLYATLAAAVTYPMLVVMPSLSMLGLSRFLLGLLFGATQVASAPLMMTLTANEHQTHQFSYHSVVSMLATAGGSFAAGYLPLLAAGLLDVGAQSTPAYGTALIITGVLIAISALPLAYLQGETAIIRRSGLARRLFERVPDHAVPWRLLARLSLPFMFFGFSGGLTFPFYNLLFRNVYNVPDATVGTILSLGWLGMGLVTVSNPWWDRRFGRARGLGITMSIAAVAFLALSIAPVLGLAVIAYVIATSVRNTMSPLFQPLLMDSLPPGLHNLASSVGFVLWNIGYFIASILGGMWQTQRGFGFLMQVVAVAVFITGMTVVWTFRNRQPYQVHD
jgi:MFS family permease